MKAQLALNKVMEFAYKQNARCEAEDGKCMYRGPNNTKCFVGCMIPDESYDNAMENTNAAGIMDDFSVMEYLLLDGYQGYRMRDFWLGMQMIHDSSEPDAWAEEFEKLADEYDLEIQVTQ